MHSNEQFIKFFKETIDNLPQNTILKGVLIDKGFFSEDIWQYVGSSLNLVKKSIRTIRRIFINIPANIVKKGGRRYTIRLPKLDYLKKIVESIKDRLYMFAFRQCYYGT